MNWYFSAEELSKPVREGGTSLKQSLKYRRQTCEFLQQLGVVLQLPQLTIATGFVYFHRFFALKDFEDHDRSNVGIACLFLAGKVEETPKKLKDFIIYSHRILHHISSPKEKYVPLKLDSPKYEEFREKILLSERIVMQTIAFDFIVEHPYKFLLDYVKRVNGGQELAQSAWNFVNDSLRTMLCLQYKPHVIACAAIYLASKRPQNKYWVELMVNDVTKKELDDISDQILELYPDEFPLKQQSKLLNSSAGPSPLHLSPLSGSGSPESVNLSPLSDPVHTPSPHLMPQNSKSKNSKEKQHPHQTDSVPPPPSEEPPPPPLPPPPPENPPPSPHRYSDRTDRDHPDRNRRGSSPADRTQNRDYRKKDKTRDSDRDSNYDNNRDRDQKSDWPREKNDDRSSYRFDRYKPEEQRGKDRSEWNDSNRDRDRDRDRDTRTDRDLREPRDLRDKVSRDLRDRDLRDRDLRDHDTRGDRDLRDRDRDLRDHDTRDRDLRDRDLREHDRDLRDRERDRDLRDYDRDLRDLRYVNQQRWDRDKEKDWDRHRSDMRFVSRKK